MDSNRDVETDIEGKWRIKMGNLIMKVVNQKITTHSFPCQTCRRVFEREISGSLLCPECRIYNKFNMMDYETKHAYIVGCSTFPSYSIVKLKNFQTKLEVKLDANWSKTVKEQIKVYSLDPKLEKKYKMIKYINGLIEKSELFVDNLKGYCIQINKEDILLVYDPEIQDVERVLFIDFESLVNKIRNA